MCPRIRKGNLRTVWNKLGARSGGRALRGEGTFWEAGAGEGAGMKRRLRGQEDKDPLRKRGWEWMEGTGSESGGRVSRRRGISAARVPGDARYRPPAWVGDGDIRGETHQAEVILCPSARFCQRQKQQEDDRGQYLNSTASPEPRHPRVPGSAQEHLSGSIRHHLSRGSQTQAPWVRRGLASVS